MIQFDLSLGDCILELILKSRRSGFYDALRTSIGALKMYNSTGVQMFKPSVHQNWLLNRHPHQYYNILVFIFVIRLYLTALVSSTIHIDILLFFSFPYSIYVPETNLKPRFFHLSFSQKITTFVPQQVPAAPWLTSDYTSSTECQDWTKKNSS